MFQMVTGPFLRAYEKHDVSRQQLSLITYSIFTDVIVNHFRGDILLCVRNGIVDGVVSGPGN